MKINNTVRRVSFVFLCFLPLINIVAVGVRALRVPVVFEIIGGVLFAVIVFAAWTLGGRHAISSDTSERRRLALAGVLLISQSAIVSLLWVGLGTPWDATPTENKMRYLVLLFGSVVVTSAFIVLKELLSDAGERFYSTLGFAANLLGGAAYLIWTSFEIGVYAVRVRDGQLSPTTVLLGDIFDVLLFVACVLTYLAVAAFAVSLGKIKLISRSATRIYVIANLFALVLIMIRGLSFPDPTAAVTPWYMNLGFIAGIPAVPWIMPFLLGVVLLRRAGDEEFSLGMKDISP